LIRRPECGRKGLRVDRSFVNRVTLRTAKTSSRALALAGVLVSCLVAVADNGGDAGGVHPVRLADGRSGGVDGLACGYATGEVALTPRAVRHRLPLARIFAKSSAKKSGRRCRIGAVVFVAGVRPPARGGTKVKEPRS